MKVDEIFLEPDVAGAHLRLVEAHGGVHRGAALTAVTFNFVQLYQMCPRRPKCDQEFGRFTLF